MKEYSYTPMLKLTMKRKEKRLTIKSLALKTGLHYNTVISYELGRHRPSIDNLQKLADVLECEVKDIV